ncbi:flavocytochrome c [Lactobacillus pentosus]|jgi:fumarate reductase flavoprotein subunit|uniref:Flavocytochrome c n=2 Tax=Lactiplantibacillus pentosus TaxID=1589 RepID=A0A2S9VI65_LACPE|nr:flavocytochrome c [Lactiplantibacillus pentosus]MCH4129349.1 flavocytochrome c [Lactiplantibacillus sp.]CCC16127.1 fumarate reductase, flavoprotein subunit, N-terminally truncated [Lactiplantibacillus pentosus IG1]BBM20671.1 fumarate reductase, flavoprotein subunit [Lactiplantibacillus plantarum]ASG78930.1 flavocytochrome c [Lactiplantibacillus pentosus]AYG36827.1 flavocytochrome c [Lactiplantibacillus pentosus]
MADKFTFTPTALADLKTTYDVVIIGSGGAGLTAAIQAHELGLKPVILEKMPKIGGNTTRASSGMNAAETNVQLHHHIVDSFGDFYDETLKGGGNLNNQALLKFFTEHSALAIDWLADHGIELDDLTITGGMSVMRTHRPSSMAPIGGFLVTELLKQVAAAKLPLFTDIKVDQLVQTDGKITGVKATTANGAVTINAGAVLLATGGFGANKALLGKYRDDLKNYQTTNQPGATGDGILLAEAVGAKVVDMDQVQVHPTVQQDTDHAYLIGEAVRGEGAILVDQQGKRFVNELDTRKNVTAAIDQLGGTGAYLIFDRGIRDRVKAVEFYDHIGLVKTGADLAALATEAGLDADTLKQTVADWNQAVANHADTAFNRTTGMDRDIAKGPFYAIHIAPAVHYTMGGVGINPATQVLDKQDQPINGLFAAGEVVGGLHGNNRIGGNSIAETVIFGRQAGQQMFKYLQ